MVNAVLVASIVAMLIISAIAIWVLVAPVYGIEIETNIQTLVLGVALGALSGIAGNLVASSKEEYRIVQPKDSRGLVVYIGYENIDKLKDLIQKMLQK